MTPVEIAVTLAGIALAVAVNVWFFAPGRAGPRGASDEDRGGHAGIETAGGRGRG